MTTAVDPVVAADPTAPVIGRRRRGRPFLAVLPPLLVGVAGLLLWELTVKLGRVAPYVLPAPSAPQLRAAGIHAAHAGDRRG
ncbi:hypothetical protein AB0H87_23915, partial [Asanoa sp. NPDC050611]